MRQQVRAYEHRLETLTGMRFIAAFLVFLCHTSVNRIFADHGLDDGFFRVVGRAGWTGVEFFFILSGFVLTWSARPGDTLLSFWRRRAAKIYPNNVVTWLAAVALLALTAGSLPPLRTALPNLFALQSWYPDVKIFMGVNAPSWSLCCEALFYASFPLLLRVINRIPARWLWASAAAIVGAIALLPVLSQLLPAKPLFPVFLAPWPRFWFVYAFPVSRVLDFALGIVVARLVLTGRWVNIGLLPAGILAVLCYAATTVAPVLFALSATMVVPLALLIGAGAAADINRAPSPFRTGVMVWLGEVSFAFYMVHVLVMTYVLKEFGKNQAPLPGVGIALLILAGSLVFGALLYRFVETPSMRTFGRRRTGSGDAVRTVQPAADSPSRDAASLAGVTDS